MNETQDKILKLLMSTDDYVSGQRIAKSVGTSRQAVWKCIGALKENGYEIDSVKNRGYRLSSIPNFLNAEVIQSKLDTKVIGKELIVLDTIDSTNDLLKRLGSQGCESGTVVAAREQTKGKGRLGRAWQTKKDDCIAFSLLLRPMLAPSEISAITPLAGLAVCKTIREYTGIDCKIKWPNDIISGKKKLVGILTELSAEFDAVNYIVIGIGINVEQTDFPEDIANKATSILLETGKHIDKNEFLARVLNQLEREFAGNRLRLTMSAVKEYVSLCATIGRSVSFTRGTQNLSGRATGINEYGELEVILSDGTKCTVNSGEVTVQGIY